MFNPVSDQFRVDREAREKQLQERYDPNWEVINVSLLGLPRTLRKGMHKAYEICDGAIFRGLYETCMLHGEDVWILSPIYGLLQPDAIIEGTQGCLNEMWPTEQMDWACDVVGDLMDFYDQRELSVKLFASFDYERVFKKAMLVDELTWNWEVPRGWIGTTISSKLQLIDQRRG